MTFFFVVRGSLTAVASLVEHRLRTRRPSSHGSQAQPLRGMWDPPRLGHEPVSPASAGGLSTTVPPGKPKMTLFLKKVFIKLFARSHILSILQGGESHEASVFRFMLP